MLVLVTKTTSTGALIPLSKKEVTKALSEAGDKLDNWPDDWLFFVIGGNHRLHAIYRIRDLKSPTFGKPGEAGLQIFNFKSKILTTLVTAQNLYGGTTASCSAAWTSRLRDGWVRPTTRQTQTPPQPSLTTFGLSGGPSRLAC